MLSPAAFGAYPNPLENLNHGQRKELPMSEFSEPACRVVRPSTVYHGKQGLTYFEGIAAETVGAKGICMHLLTIPAGGRAKAHLHEKHETAIYVLDGEAITLYGDRLQHHVPCQAGDLVYIPAGLPHLPVNLSDKPIAAVITRTDPSEQESVVLLPKLEAAAEEKIAALKSAQGRPVR
jgi:uncharacterized RmlC-like cupin family protein